MKKLLFILAIFSLVLMSCTKDPTPELTTYTVTFDSLGGTDVSSQTIVDGEPATKPTDPTKEGFVFKHWYVTDEETEYIFSTPITGNITLYASWDEETPIGPTNEELIQDDIEAIEENLYLSDYQLSLPSRGPVSKSYITWKSESIYITSTGILLPTPSDEEVTQGEITASFTLGGTKVDHTFTVDLQAYEGVTISTSREVPFTNLTDEYDVADGEVTLYFEDEGSVPYIKLLDFFTLLQGFIDPEVEFSIVEGEDTLEISYQYIDEDFDEVYDLVLTIDATENTISTNDPGFYWAYVYTTETNYGRNITYVKDHPNDYTLEGENVVYDLDPYFMDIVVYEDDIVLPYYIVNQLFAGSSYYNVYYNHDGLFGIYALPDSESDEYITMKDSTLNNEELPIDLLINTFHSLAFVMDHFYGLKEIMSVDTYFDILYTNRNTMLNTNARQLDYNLANFLLKTIDEPHTSYGYPSYFNDPTWAGPEVNSLSAYGTRFNKWYMDGLVAVNDQLIDRWDEDEDMWFGPYTNRPNYWFINDETGVLALDGFVTSDMEETDTFDVSVVDEMMISQVNLLPAINEGSRFYYYNNSTDEDRLVEILVKGVTPTYIEDYQLALTNFGFTHVIEETTSQSKKNGYYQLDIPADLENDARSYMVQISYDETYDFLYVGIMDKLPVSYRSTWPFSINISNLLDSDSAMYMEFMLQEMLEEKPGMINIILDVSANTGGNVGALYRVVGFITDQPFAVSGIDRDTGGASTYHVQITGTPSYAHLNWGLLTTPMTFSAANSLATIFKENALGPIIGVRSGGGACSITPILLPNGTAFTMSSNNINAYRTGSGTDEDPYVYVNNEFGIVPDYPIAIDQIYDGATLLQIFE